MIYLLYKCKNQYCCAPHGQKKQQIIRAHLIPIHARFQDSIYMGLAFKRSNRSLQYEPADYHVHKQSEAYFDTIVCFAHNHSG